MIPIDLQGRTALVTGATGELGRVISRKLAEAGADVAVHYLHSADKAEALVEELCGMGRESAAFSADITDAGAVETMQKAVAGRLGSPDILVNNAVIQYDWKTVLEQPIADYESQFRSCVLHNVLMAQAFTPAMMGRGWGRVIAINTECAMQCTSHQSAYVAGKRGMDGVLKCLAREIGGKGVTVNQVAPGWMTSENRTDEGTPQSYLDRVALGHRGTDLDIAHAVLFLASDLAGFITGAFLPVCGGAEMNAI